MPIGEAVQALEDARRAGTDKREIPVRYSPTTEDRLQSLVDVLENLPAAKPSWTSMLVQLASPGLLAAKAGYDLISGLREIIKAAQSAPAADNTKAVVFVVINFVLVLLAVAFGAVLVAAFRAARSKKDPHHQRALARAKAQLAAITGEPS